MRAIFRLLVLTIAFDFCTAGPGARAHGVQASVRGTPASSSRAPAQTHGPPHHTPDSLNHRTTTTTVISLPYSMEIRRRRGMVPTVAEPRGRTRRRRSTTTSGTRVQYRSQVDRQFRQRGDFPLYLASNSTGTALELAPQNSTHDNHTRFRLHLFDLMTLDADTGEVVVMQTHDGGRFLHADSSGNLSLLAGEGESISGVRWVDNRFFLLHAARGDTSYQIKHLATGRYLSAGVDGVSLVTSDQGVSDDMLFDMFCS